VLVVSRENGVQGVQLQAEPGSLGTAPPWGALLPVPGGVPRRGKGRSAPHGGRVLIRPHSSRGRSKEGDHLLPWRPPSQALSRSLVEVGVDSLEFRLTNFRERRLLGVQPTD